MSTLMEEILQQPEYLRRLIADYQGSDRIQKIISTHSPERWVLTGMGASFHAAWIGSIHLNTLGIPAAAHEATDLLNYSRAALTDPAAWLVYVSQSGTSGEVSPFLETMRPGRTFLTITNNVESGLAQKATWMLPMNAGEEHLVATKTYINPLAILWLLGRQAAGTWTGQEYQELQRVADRVERTLANADRVAARLIETFSECSPVLFLGHGPHGVTARQSAMVMSEWAKLPALHAGVGAFRHGFIETVQPGFGVVVFAAPGRAYASSISLASELAEYGARVLVIENGELCEPGQRPAQDEPVDEFLSPILDMIPIQLYTEGLAREKNIDGFRYIGKVVSKL
jgi:glutamine---fructose-6-phosphate transaminase (isomerizing)